MKMGGVVKTLWLSDSLSFASARSCQHGGVFWVRFPAPVPARFLGHPEAGILSVKDHAGKAFLRSLDRQIAR